MENTFDQLFQSGGIVDLLFKFIIFYLFVLWILFPFWVYLDAKKRYANKYVPLIFFIFILPFNLPGLVFYFVIRPEHKDDNLFSHLLNEGVDDSVKIPIANFIDKENVVISLQMNINKRALNLDNSNVVVDLKMDSKDGKFAIAEASTDLNTTEKNLEKGKKSKKEEVKVTEVSERVSVLSKFKNTIRNSVKELKMFVLNPVEVDDK